MEDSKIICNNWGKIPLDSIADKCKLSIYDLLVLAYKLNLQRLSTPNIGRTWTDEEERFLQEYSSRLTTLEASNLLYRSRHAVYERCLRLGIYDNMVKKKRIQG